MAKGSGVGEVVVWGGVVIAAYLFLPTILAKMQANTAALNATTDPTAAANSQFAKLINSLGTSLASAVSGNKSAASHVGLTGGSPNISPAKQTVGSSSLPSWLGFLGDAPMISNGSLPSDPLAGVNLSPPDLQNVWDSIDPFSYGGDSIGTAMDNILNAPVSMPTLDTSGSNSYPADNSNQYYFDPSSVDGSNYGFDPSAYGY